MSELAELYRMMRRRDPSLRAVKVWHDAERQRTPSYELEFDDGQGRHGPDGSLVAELHVDGYDVKVRVVIDEDPQVMGKFTDTWEPGVVAIPENRDRNDRYTYFLPDCTYEGHRRGLLSMGYPKHEADCLARSYVKQDMERATSEDYCQYVAIVCVEANGVELAHDALGGIDVGDMTGLDAQRELASVILDHGMIDEALDGAKKARKGLVNV